MEEQKKTETATTGSKQAPFAHRTQQRRQSSRPPRRSSRGAFKPADELEQKIVDLARVTRVMAGGKRMKFRVCMIVGDKRGRVGMGIAKGADVSMAISKAVTKAKKHMINVPIIDGTIPHAVRVKVGAAIVLVKPARAGSGVKAGGVMRIVLELAGIKDAAAKILGTSNKLNNAEATIVALSSFVPRATARAKSFKDNKITAKPIQTLIKEKDSAELKK